MKWPEEQCQEIWNLEKEFYRFYYLIGRPSDLNMKVLGVTVKEVMFGEKLIDGKSTTPYKEISKVKEKSGKILGKELTELFFPILDFMTREEFIKYESLKKKYGIQGYDARPYAYMKHRNN